MAIQFSNNKLKGKIVEKCGTITEFAKQFGISLTAMNNKLNGNTNWNRDDIIKASIILDIFNDPEELVSTFFSVKNYI